MTRELKPEFGNIEEAKQVFNINQARYHSKLPGFEELFNLFSNNCTTFSDIGRELGLTREAIRYIYNKYFRRFLGGKSGRVRVKVCSRLNRLSLIIKKFNQFPATRVLLEITGGKLEIKPVGLSKKFMVINGHKCLVKNTFAWRRMNEFALRFHLPISLSRNSLMGTDFLIIISGRDKEKIFFIIPTSVILGVSPEKAERWSIFIPSTNVVYNNHPPRIDFWEYAKAWHLLETPKYAPQEIVTIPA